jgi:hypothetical protein
VPLYLHARDLKSACNATGEVEGSTRLRDESN